MCRKSLVTRHSQAPASTSAWSISTPGMTGNVGKWSARYSSPRVRNLEAVSDLPGSHAWIRSTRLEPHGASPEGGSRRPVGGGRPWRGGRYTRFPGPGNPDRRRPTRRSGPLQVGSTAGGGRLEPNLRIRLKLPIRALRQAAEPRAGDPYPCPHGRRLPVPARPVAPAAGQRARPERVPVPPRPVAAGRQPRAGRGRPPPEPRRPPPPPAARRAVPPPARHDSDAPLGRPGARPAAEGRSLARAGQTAVPGRRLGARPGGGARPRARTWASRSSPRTWPRTRQAPGEGDRRRPAPRGAREGPGVARRGPADAQVQGRVADARREAAEPQAAGPAGGGRVRRGEAVRPEAGRHAARPGPAGPGPGDRRDGRADRRRPDGHPPAERAARRPERGRQDGRRSRAGPPAGRLPPRGRRRSTRRAGPGSWPASAGSACGRSAARTWSASARRSGPSCTWAAWSS